MDESDSAGAAPRLRLRGSTSWILEVVALLQRGEPFHWVFSSQTFFFPEFPLSAICGLVMGSPQGGLVLNAILNVLVL